MPDQATLESALQDEDRLEALRRTGLLDTPPEEEFDRLTRLVCRLLGVPAALVSLVEANRQFFKSAVGLPEPWLLRRETSLLHSFCQHVVASGAPLLIQDAGKHPLVSGNLAVPDLGVLAYLGMPLTTGDGHVLGALCAIDTEPRTWLPGDAAVLRDLATVTMSEVTLRWLAREMSERMRGEIAARKAATAKARRLEAVRQFANCVAHEFAGVMQSVQSGVRLATARLGQEDPATAQSILALVGDVAQRGGALSERLLAFTPRGEHQAEQVDVGALLRRVERVLSGTSGAPIHAKVDIEPGLPSVLANPEELKAVLLGLAGLARRAMPEGGILRLGAVLDDVANAKVHPARLRPGRYVRLVVVDTGTGTAGAKHATSEVASLTAGGLATHTEFELALALDLIEQLGGGLIQESKPGIGTTITLWLPANEADTIMNMGVPKE